MIWLVYALLAPFLWALTNHLDKFIIDKRVNGLAQYIFFGSFGTVILIIGILLFKGVPTLSFGNILLAMLIGVLSNFGIITYAKAMQKEDASTIVPLFQFVPVLVLILGYIFLNEALSNQILLGFLVVFSGGVIVSIDTKVKKIFKIRPAFWFMVAASLFFAIAFILTRYMFSNFGFFDVYTYDLIGFLLPAIVLLFHKQSRIKIIDALRNAKKSTFALFLLNDIIDMSGNIFLILALTIAPAALVSVMSGIQPFFVLSIGLFFTSFFPHIIKESVSRQILLRKIIGISIILIGIILISV